MERNMLLREIGALDYSQGLLPNFNNEGSVIDSIRNVAQSYLQLNSIRQNVAGLALAEYQNWQKGLLNENSPKALPFLEKYFKIGGGLSAAKTQVFIKDRNAWSSVFIAYVMKQVYPNFKTSAFHTEYIDWAKKNRTSKAHPFEAFRINEVSVQVGDIICNSRAGSGASFDKLKDSKGNWLLTHGDIVMEVDSQNRELKVLGGNKGNTVQYEKLKISIDASGKLVQRSKDPFFAVIKIVDSANATSTSFTTATNTTHQSSFISAIEDGLKSGADLYKKSQQNQKYATELGWLKHRPIIRVLLLSSHDFNLVFGDDDFAFIKAVAKWQQANGFSGNAADGVIGPKTWEKMKVKLNLLNGSEQSQVKPSQSSFKASRIKWFKDYIAPKAKYLLAQTPFDENFLAAIAFQETGYLWGKMIGKLPLNEILLNCAGDTIGSPARKAFPINKDELVNYREGQKMFFIAREALEKLTKWDKAYQKAFENPNKFCRGYGMFQYDLQHFKSNPSFFLEKKWGDLDSCLEMVIKELKSSQNRIKSYRGKGTLTDREKIMVAIAYNKGTANIEADYKQGFKNDEGKYYGECINEFYTLAKSL